ncbi:Methylated-DNA--protein-cysteine methyltransferase, inducible [Anaerococcus prevotii]|uniref:methylated-DNA--[protein]-cysteine S-methyltransferase n=1 Tax=Anaerococcus prevotii (strain ATCC 9321 / DSM 20548 / JCM 6508 / NCTC 11806 / PC1) TaxID=525919 RepID=C7RFC5_ANAPD|nr:methylated-DNA--[protein]-cysteine S-methyltransferase [Anaerococcus prevotii]ACV28186.1 methylated-DNA/protein-cysteinemethyltransferase [Anaerococcus prevotii DSM 20548]SUU93740.1 Methylated-DNA--protein-cysteine methyltransferase, inducible [Anaerococcus prevotii]
MKYAFYKSRIGILKFSYDKKIESISLVKKSNALSERTPATDKVFGQIEEYLRGERKEFTIYDLLEIMGTDFQKEVIKELRNIPYGEKSTYKKVAKNINRKKATRAVANAIGRNPFFIIYPCHRVIRSDGKIGGFAYGVEVKRFLLKLES